MILLNQPLIGSGYIPTLVEQYLANDPAIHPFFTYHPGLQGVERAVKDRRAFPVDRKRLQAVLKKQYRDINIRGPVEENINRLADNNTFTVCTAHQCNIFTGYLYFFHKIFTVIRLAADLNKEMPQYHFVPVFWMGSEDHDLEELNRINIYGQQLIWNTHQTGPTGRMQLSGIEVLIDRLESLLGHKPGAAPFLQLVRKAYHPEHTLAHATRLFVHSLLKEYGIVILDQDDADLKALMTDVFTEEFIRHTGYQSVMSTIETFPGGIKPQANPRKINLFYIDNGIRERFIRKNGYFQVLNTTIKIPETEIKRWVEENYFNISPNVITRPLYQETVLPNIAFAGGGAEVAYWLELKQMFTRYNRFYPAVFMRDVVTMVHPLWLEKMRKLELEPADFLLSQHELEKRWIKNHSQHAVSLNGEFQRIKAIYENIKTRAAAIDVTLVKAVEAEMHRQLKSLENLEKRLIKAEKRNLETAINQIGSLYEKLFPGNNLQERHENFIPFYVDFGPCYFQSLYDDLTPFAPGFKWLTCQSR